MSTVRIDVGQVSSGKRRNLGPRRPKSARRASRPTLQSNSSSGSDFKAHARHKHFAKESPRFSESESSRSLKKDELVASLPSLRARRPPSLQKSKSTEIISKTESADDMCWDTFEQMFSKAAEKESPELGVLFDLNRYDVGVRQVQRELPYKESMVCIMFFFITF